jgi:hypothetical protein
MILCRWSPCYFIFFLIHPVYNCQINLPNHSHIMGFSCSKSLLALQSWWNKLLTHKTKNTLSWIFRDLFISPFAWHPNLCFFHCLASTGTLQRSGNLLSTLFTLYSEIFLEHLQSYIKNPSPCCWRTTQNKSHSFFNIILQYVIPMPLLNLMFLFNLDISSANSYLFSLYSTVSSLKNK